VPLRPQDERAARPGKRHEPRQDEASENDCVASAMAPARSGPMACPMPKTTVTSPSAAGAARAPKRSPQTAAMMPGMLHAVMENKKAEP